MYKNIAKNAIIINIKIEISLHFLRRDKNDKH